MMDSNEEFVVVNEENDNQRDSIARLDVLVDLFKKTIDELQTALSVTLQNVTPDHTSTIEDLVKQLDSIKWKKLIEPISMVAAGIKELESVFSSKSEVDSTDVEPSLSDDSTVDDVCSFLTTMYGKIQNIRDKEPVARKSMSSVVFVILYVW
ncbi:unnamed protein product [Trichobilharzia regenti]|nr:unnamed protein product [Trichobilharzia regenti]